MPDQVRHDALAYLIAGLKTGLIQQWFGEPYPRRYSGIGKITIGCPWYGARIGISGFRMQISDCPGCLFGRHILPPAGKADASQLFCCRYGITIIDNHKTAELFLCHPLSDLLLHKGMSSRIWLPLSSGYILHHSTGY